MASLIMAADGSFADPEEKQPTPMEAIASAGEQRPGIEDQDINDGWLIENTQQLDCGNGMMKYQIMLPDGNPFECTPFRIENRRDMSKMWMAAVRGEIVSRANAATEVTRAAALKARRDKQMQGAGILVTGQIPTPEEAAALAASVKQAPPPPPEHAREVIRQMREEAAVPAIVPSGTTDPMEHAQQQYDQAMAELQHWADLARKAAQKQKAAQKAALRWKTVIEAFTDDEPQQELEAVPSVGKPSSTRAETLARTLQTSSTAKRK